ncbi:GAP family protein [Mycobacterium sp. THU-M104]|uniref:GAP family protein n=1 Tax=Mycobacterium sp. THU-M104 TaxID=3410515 RepID=UPI003B9C755D
MLWNSVLFLGFGMALDPLRLGLVAVVLSRKRPMLNLFAFWMGGMIAGIGIGMAVLVVMRETAMAALRSAAAMIEEVRSSVAFFFGGGHLKITLGAIALVSLVVLLSRERARTLRLVTAGSGHSDGSGVAAQPRVLRLFAKLGTLNQRILDRGFFWPAFLVGLGSATPPVETLMLLTIIMASGAAIGTQFSAFLVYTVMVLAVIEIPLVCHLVEPEKTQTAMSRMQNWLHVHRARISQTALGVSGVALMVQGIGSL